MGRGDGKSGKGGGKRERGRGKERGECREGGKGKGQGGEKCIEAHLLDFNPSSTYRS